MFGEQNHILLEETQIVSRETSIDRMFHVKHPGNMIYFDYAATSYPKPRSVQDEIKRVLVDYGGNAGRGDYPLAKYESIPL